MRKGVSYGDTTCYDVLSRCLAVIFQPTLRIRAILYWPKYIFRLIDHSFTMGTTLGNSKTEFRNIRNGGMTKLLFFRMKVPATGPIR